MDCWLVLCDGALEAAEAGCFPSDAPTWDFMLLWLAFTAGAAPLLLAIEAGLSDALAAWLA